MSPKPIDHIQMASLACVMLGLLAIEAPCQHQQFGPSISPAVPPGHIAYDPAAGTWQSLVGPGTPGPDVIYASDCPNSSGTGPYFYANGWDVYSILDVGRIPSPTSPDNPPESAPGCAQGYWITGIEFGYCTDQPTLSETIHFYEQADLCSNPSTLTPTKSITFSSLPGSSDGTVACYFVTAELVSSGDSFFMLADGDGAYSNINLDRFGVAMGTFGTNTLREGPIVTYRGIQGCDAGVLGTVWNPMGQEVQTLSDGLGTVEAGFILSSNPNYTGCWFGNSGGGLHLRLYARACPLSGPGVGFCSGDGSATPCPCGNDGQGYHGCANSAVPHGARLEATGTASLAADDVVLRASRMPSTSPALFFQGTLQQNAGLGSVFGDGLRCAGGAVLRLGTIAASIGAAEWPQAGQLPLSQQGQVGQPGTRTYQVWYRNNASFCAPDGFNLTNGYEIAWQG